MGSLGVRPRCGYWYIAASVAGSGTGIGTDSLLGPQLLMIVPTSIGAIETPCPNLVWDFLRGDRDSLSQLGLGLLESAPDRVPVGTV